MVAESDRISGFHHIGLCLKDPLLPNSVLVEGANKQLTGDRGAFMFILCSIEWVPNEHLGMVEHQEKIDADIERVSGDMIRVEILRARNLRSLDTCFPQDPFYMVSLIPNRLNPSQIFKSKVFWGHGTNPEFEPSEPIYIELPAQMTEAEIDQTVIHIEVWDKDLLTENDLIGECEVLLSYVKQERTLDKRWLIMSRGADSWKSLAIRVPEKGLVGAEEPRQRDEKKDADPEKPPVQRACLKGVLAKAPFQQELLSPQHARADVQVRSWQELAEAVLTHRAYVIMLAIFGALFFFGAIFDLFAGRTTSLRNLIDWKTNRKIYHKVEYGLVGFYILDMVLRMKANYGKTTQPNQSWRLSTCISQRIDFLDTLVLFADLSIAVSHAIWPNNSPLSNILALARCLRFIRVLRLISETFFAKDSDKVWSLVDVCVSEGPLAADGHRLLLSWIKNGGAYGPFPIYEKPTVLKREDMDPALGLNLRPPGACFQIKFERQHGEIVRSIVFDAQSPTIAESWVSEINAIWPKRMSLSPRASFRGIESLGIDEIEEKAHQTDGVKKLTLDNSRTYVWESTGSGIAGIHVTAKDIESDDPNCFSCMESGGMIGVQVRDLDDLLKEYVGEVWALPLRSGPSQHLQSNCRFLDVLHEEQRKYVHDVVSRVHEAFHKRSYQMNVLKQYSVMHPQFRNLANCLCPCESCNESVFCSEFVVDVYQALGLMDVEVDPERVIPCDFLGGYEGFPQFGPPIPLKVHKERIRKAFSPDAFDNFYQLATKAVAKDKPDFSHHIRGSVSVANLADLMGSSSPSEAEDSEVPNPQQLQQADTRIDFGAVLPDALSNLKENPHLPKTPRYHADEGSTGKKRPSRYHIKHGNSNWFHS